MKDTMRKAIRGICIAVLVLCLGAAAFMGFSYLGSSAAYDDLRQYRSGLSADRDAGAAKEELAAMTVDWDALLSKNPDTVAWIIVEGTGIDYPVVQAQDNDYYLHTGFDGSWSASGSVFLDAADAADFSGTNSLLYGHHMRDGSMFASLAALADQDEFDKCEKAYLLTPSRSMLLRPVALLDVGESDALVQERPSSSEGLQKHISQVMDRAVCKASDVALDDLTQTVELVTCDELGDNGRYVLVCSVELSVTAE